MLLCITTVKAESVTFSTARIYSNIHEGWSSDEQNTARNNLLNDCATQSNEDVKVEFKNPGTEQLSHSWYGPIIINVGIGSNLLVNYYLWISASQVEVSLLNPHAEIESIKVSYVDQASEISTGYLFDTKDQLMDFPAGQTSHLFTFADSNQKVSSITVNYHYNHEYGEEGAAYYTCQVCGHVDEERKAACADRALHLTAVGGDVHIGMKKTGSPADYTMQYSLDKQNWTTLTLTATTDILTIPAGQTCYFRYPGDTPIDRISTNQNNCWSFTMTGEGTIEAGGSVMSMLDISAQKPSLSGSRQHAFTALFKDCDKLTVAPELPAETISQFCYMYMFAGTSITEAPALPAVLIPDGAYFGMFQDCKKLSSVPALPGRILKRVAYRDMLHGCEKLTTLEIANTITTIDNDNPFTDWLTGTAVDTTGLLIAPDAMVGNTKIPLPANWQYKQISDFLESIREASEGLSGTLMEIVAGYLTQISEANNYSEAKALYDQAIKEIAVLKKCDMYKHEDYTAPEGAGCRLQITTNSGRTYEFQTTSLNRVDYYQCGTLVPDDANALTMVFSGSANPVETQHALQGLNLNFRASIDQVELMVHGATATYPLSHLSGIEHFRGTPAVTLATLQHPSKAHEYYATFYSGLEAYAIPEGVKAYTAELVNLGTSTWLEAHAIAGGIVPQGEAVLLKSGDTAITMETTESVSVSATNVLRGFDVATPISSTVYALDVKDGKMGFYPYAGDRMPANTAYLEWLAATPAPSYINFNTQTYGTPTGIQNVNDNENDNVNANVNKYLRNGQLYIEREGRTYNAQGALVK